MLQTAEAPRPRTEPDRVKIYCQSYRWMLLARLVEEKLVSLYRGGKIHGGVFIGKGQEALSVAIGMSLRKGDIFAPLIRDQAGRLAFGESLLDCTRTYMGSRLGPMRGRDGNVHRGRPHEGLFPMISHLGAMIPVVSGALLARRFRGVIDTVGATSIGEGGTSTGAFHEALNQAAIEHLPLVVVVANNQYAYSTPNERQFVCRDLVNRAIGYGIEGHSVDGTDLIACLDVVGRAVAHARSGHGPQLVVASLLRLCGHGEHDDASYVDPALRESPIGRDCLRVAEEHLLAESWASADVMQQWQDQAAHQVEEAVAMTLREAPPDPATEDWCALATRHLIDSAAPE
ncbi:MAG: thiamine pyrophosphate-dependent dehydrogenase E1 component subunit alpha [Verrucomicrobiota bacterium]|nr:thiamine pyrophosphate-dependent dehydrogenase E1 component subunit alpha [Verrucomicrobiota bacterium]